MDLSSTLSEDRDDEIARAFPGCVLTHVIRITSIDRLALAMEALQAVREYGGALEALHLHRRGEDLEHQLKVAGPTPREARLLANRIAALPGASAVTVEHHLARRG